MATADIVEQRNMDCKVYGSSINPDVLDYIASGKIDACTGGEVACGGVAVTLLANYMDGHPIKGSDGEAPIIDELHHFVVTPENAQAFKDFLTNPETSTGTISAEEYQSLLYRNNPDVTIDDYVQMMNSYPENVYEKIGAAK